MNDDTAPAWAIALVKAINALRTEMQDRFDYIERSLNALEDKIAAAETARSEGDVARTQIRGWRQETGHE